MKSTIRAARALAAAVAISALVASGALPAQAQDTFPSQSIDNSIFCLQLAQWFGVDGALKFPGCH